MSIETPVFLMCVYVLFPNRIPPSSTCTNKPIQPSPDPNAVLQNSLEIVS